MGDELLTEQKGSEELTIAPLLETVNKVHDVSLQRKVNQSKRGVREEFLRVARIVHDIGDVLQLIQSFCSNKMSDEAEQSVIAYTEEILELKSKFKNESYKFQSFLLRENTIDEPTHRFCNESLKKFNNTMDRIIFVDIYTQLPAAIKRGDEGEIQKFGKAAGGLANDLKWYREEIMSQLDGKSKCTIS